MCPLGRWGMVQAVAARRVLAAVRVRCCQARLLLQLLPSLLLAAQAALAHAPVGPKAGYLGLATDQFGIYHEAPLALNSLHQDYQFFHHHEMAAGRLDLDSVATFGDSAHVRLLPSLKAHASGGNASITLDLCNGDTSVSLVLQTPPARALERLGTDMPSLPRTPVQV